MIVFQKISIRSMFRSISYIWTWEILIYLFCYIAITHEKSCARENSRVVAKVVRERVFPVFEAHKMSLTSNCLFSLDRDMYSLQENHKVLDPPSRWTCNFCGKAFVSEYFLDRHFENRHMDQIQTDDAICLADVCDIFRCDIISGASHPDYWDIALCMEDDMEELFAQCKTIVEDCVPSGPSKNETDIVKSQGMENLCSFLTCSKFWNTPYQQEENSHTALYIVLTTMTCFGIVVYNFVFYNYFYSDLVETNYDVTPKPKHKIKKFNHDIAYGDSTRLRLSAD
ncbi:zinc finger C2H2-type domain-containing protein [Biomphalaria glabrata]|nr:CAunnamed protein product [Biomphalaria glabrata]